ncbi:MAG TPA: hypothetical protein EYQ31_14310 [Candidatus Handelsmanbacteria bacterium]|nr:hypothetical protein [Candidatus Handelsmanbacteria bacterium]
MSDNEVHAFSMKWVLFSVLIYITAEIVLGLWVGGVVVGKYISISLRFMLQGLLNLASYFVGGFIIGLISPGLRIYEPAAGAFLAVSLTLLLSFFTPYSFIQFSMTKMLLGGGIAFFLALAGARLGERLCGNHG